jgi:hypothetical protein
MEYQNWEVNLDLPDPEAWLAQAVQCRQNGATLTLDIPPRCDQVMAVLGALVDRVKNHQLGPDGKPIPERWLAAVKCFAEVGKVWMEPAISAAAGLYFSAPGDKGASIVKANSENPEFSALVLDIHKNVSAAN